jgi:hypothetical protein
VLRDKPEQEARLASSLVGRLGLDFYVANAEAAYGYTGPDGPSDERSSRSRRFVRTFRSLRPSLLAGLSSYCRPNLHDLNWKAWRAGGFVFLPQAYVNQLGRAVAPRACVSAATGYFPRTLIHPTVGTFSAPAGLPSANECVTMLEQAGTKGFSLYLAETTSPESWQAFGAGIANSAIAR